MVLSYTSNMVSSGLRDVIRFLCQEKLVDAVMSSCGGIEEDFIKCQNKFYVGEFFNDDAELRANGINRIGNMLVPNENYCDFETFLLPIIKEFNKRIEEEGFNLTPSKLIREMGKRINHEESIYYQCYKNDIPVFCPGITDGAIGDVFFFQTYKYENLVLDITEDLYKLNDLVREASYATALVLGGGFIKHSVLQAGQFRGGYDSLILINNGTGQDNSDTGKSLDFEVQRKYLKSTEKSVVVFAEASLIFPLLIHSLL